MLVENFKTSVVREYYIRTRVHLTRVVIHVDRIQLVLAWGKVHERSSAHPLEALAIVAQTPTRQGEKDQFMNM
ncbi:hypothetical protein YC2023_065008 [Brassica napus]